MKIINFKKKKIKLLTNKHQKSYQSSKTCYIYQEKCEDKRGKDKNVVKFWTIVILQGNIEEKKHCAWHIKFKV